MKKITRHIPNALTCTSLAFGFYASILGLSGDYFGAMIAIFIAAVFDFTDGFAARMLKAYSPMGKELDSLSDMVSFGVAPAMMLFCFIDNLLHDCTSWLDMSYMRELVLLSAFAIPILSALRLAKFNIDERQKTSFIGLPVPAHAIFWASLIAALSPSHADTYMNNCKFFDSIINIQPDILIIILSVLAIISSLLLVSNIPMFSLKISSFGWKEAKLQYILIISAIILVSFLGIIGISATILLYILLSAFTKKSEP